VRNGKTFSLFASSVLSFIGLGIVWCAVSALHLVDPVILPSPSDVYSAAVYLLTPKFSTHDSVLSLMCVYVNPDWKPDQAGELLRDFGSTLLRVSAALGLSVLFGVPLGLWLGWQRGLYRFIEGPVHALRSVPAAALFPLFLIVIGVGEGSIIALATYNSVVVVLINTVAGTLLANQRRLQQARALGVNGWRLITDVLFWEALPHILSGTRIATGYSLALIIAVEMFIGVSSLGLGRKIYDYQAAYRIPETYAAILLTGLLGLGLNGLLSLLERRLLRWLPMTHEDPKT